MLRFFRNFTGLIVSSIIFVICFILFALHTATKSDVEPGIEHETQLISDSIKIYRNKFSIPHIITNNELDGYFALGYVHAQDRLWQMDIARRTGKGQLAQVLGKEALPTDKFMRSFDLWKTVQGQWKKLSKRSKSILEAYTKGVNFFLEESKGSLPFEFGAMDYTPEQWDVLDCLVIGKVMSMELSMSMWADIAFGELASRIGTERAKQLLPDYPLDAPVIIPTKNPPPPLPTKDTTLYSSYMKDKNVESTMITMGNILNHNRSFLGFTGSGNGSNCWTMRKTHDTKSVAILANDPHLSLSLPARWYPAHVTTKSSNIIGMTIAGLPSFIIGRNDNITWGITNMMADDFDYFIEKTDPKNNNYYFDEQGNRKKFSYRRDTIMIRDDEPFIYDIRFTSRSSVVSDAHLLGTSSALLKIGDSKPATYYTNNSVLTYRWTATIASDEVLALYNISKAKSWNDYSNALQNWGSPALNFVYADKFGNSGVIPSGMLPKRINNPAYLPALGYAPATDWAGVFSTGILPKSYNPPRRFIAVANNKITENPDVFVTHWWEPSSRAERLIQALSQFDEYDVRDAQFLQQDVISPYAKRMVLQVLPILKTKRKYLPKDADSVLTVLQRWDGLMGAGRWQPTVFALFQDELIRSTFVDEMGERLFRQYSLVANIPIRKIEELLNDKKSPWFDDKTTSGIEDRDEIVFQSFVRAVRRAKEFNENGNVFDSKYGHVHKITLKHIFSTNPLLDKIVTQGPFETGGSHTSLNNGEWRIFSPFDQVLGASTRFIADMEDSVVYTVIPGGVSGEPLSAHYSDQIQLWLKGGYVKVPVSKNPAIGESLYVTIIREDD